MNPIKPFSESSEQNKQVILDIIQPRLSKLKRVLEVASGTGQHAVYFSHEMPHLHWQTSDLTENHSGISQWITDSSLTNIEMPIPLNVSSDSWPKQTYDAVFSANSFHIMAASNVTDFFKNIASVINDNGLIIIYGPFNYDGHFTSESNARFDAMLRERGCDSCIKDFEWCNELAESAGFKLIEDHEMPQNNRILAWQKQD
jgi:cyclopropane fatty-acyl-phospholipid synthase-like methyltransferase